MIGIGNERMIRRADRNVNRLIVPSAGGCHPANDENALADRLRIFGKKYASKGKKAWGGFNYSFFGLSCAAWQSGSAY
jgi:hypothetical protein